jgi:pilus assembly protein Flp/PilA
MSTVRWLAALVLNASTALIVHIVRRAPLRSRQARGQGLVEYALILVLIAVVVIGSLSLLGARTSQVYGQVTCALDGGVYHQDRGNGKSNKCK